MLTKLLKKAYYKYLRWKYWEGGHRYIRYIKKGLLIFLIAFLFFFFIPSSLFGFTWIFEPLGQPYSFLKYSTHKLVFFNYPTYICDESKCIFKNTKYPSTYWHSLLKNCNASEIIFYRKGGAYVSLLIEPIWGKNCKILFYMLAPREYVGRLIMECNVLKSFLKEGKYGEFFFFAPMDPGIAFDPSIFEFCEGPLKNAYVSFIEKFYIGVRYS